MTHYIQYVSKGSTSLTILKKITSFQLQTVRLFKIYFQTAMKYQQHKIVFIHVFNIVTGDGDIDKISPEERNIFRKC